MLTGALDGHLPSSTPSRALSAASTSLLTVVLFLYNFGLLGTISTPSSSRTIIKFPSHSSRSLFPFPCPLDIDAAGAHPTGNQDLDDRPTPFISLNFPGRVGGFLRPRNKKKTLESEGAAVRSPVKKDLNAPLTSSLRPRTPSVNEALTTATEEFSVVEVEMTSADIQTEDGAAPVAESHDETNIDNAPPTKLSTESSAGKTEKPLPEPAPEQRRPGRISLRVSRLLNALPRPREAKQHEDKAGEASIPSSPPAGSSSPTTPELGAGRRLFGRVGNMVNRKSRAVSSDTEAEKTESKVDSELDKEKPAPPPVPAKSGEDADPEIQSTPEDLQTEDPPKEEDAKATATAAKSAAEELSTPPASPSSPPPPATPSSPKPGLQGVASRATRLVRRLSARGLGTVFQAKSKTDASNGSGESEAAPPVSKASLLAQRLSVENAPPDPVSQETFASPAPAPSSTNQAQINGESSAAGLDDKDLPPPPHVPPMEEEGKSTLRERLGALPPSSFKSATRIARQLSTRASELFKDEPKEDVQVALDNEGTKGAGATSSEKGGAGPTNSAGTGNLASELVRKISRGAQGALTRARSRSRARQTGSTSEVEKDAAAPPPPVHSAALETPVQGTEEASSAPVPTEDTTSAAAAAAPVAESPEETPKAASPEEDPSPEKELPPALSGTAPRPPSAAIARVGNLGRQFSDRVSGLFSGGKDASGATEEAKGEVDRPNTASVDKEQNQEENVTAAAAEPEEPQVEAKPEVSKPEGTVATANVDGEDRLDVKDSEAMAAAPEIGIKPKVDIEEAKAVTRTSIDKSLPPPPPLPSGAVAKSESQVAEGEGGEVAKGVSKPVVRLKAPAIRTLNSNEQGVLGQGQGQGQGEQEVGQQGPPGGAVGGSANPALAQALAQLKSSAGIAEFVVPSALEEKGDTLGEENPAPPAAPVKETEEVPVAVPGGSKPKTPPGAFSRVIKPKLGKRLSAKVGDLFKSRVRDAKAKEKGEGKKSDEKNKESASENAIPPAVPAKEEEEEPLVESEVKGTDNEAKVEDTLQEPARIVKDEQNSAVEQAEGEPAGKNEGPEKKEEVEVEKPIEKEDEVGAKAEEPKEVEKSIDKDEVGVENEEPEAEKPIDKEDQVAVEDQEEASAEKGTGNVKAEKPKVEESQQPEASTSTAQAQHEVVNPDKPLPSPPSRSARAKGVAVDVGRHLSIRASELLKPKPRLDELVTSSAATSKEKGRASEETATAVVEHASEGLEGATPKRSLGRGISMKVVNGIFRQGAKDEVVKAPEFPEVPAKNEAASDKKEAVGREVVESNPASSKDIKNASVEAVEGGFEIVEGPKKGDTVVVEEQHDSAKPPRPHLPKGVAGFFKARKVSDKVLHPTESDHVHEDEKSPVTEGKEPRSRQLSLGFLTKRKKEDVNAPEATKTGGPPEVPPKDVGETKDVAVSAA